MCIATLTPRTLVFKSAQRKKKEAVASFIDLILGAALPKTPYLMTILEIKFAVPWLHMVCRSMYGVGSQEHVALAMWH